MGQVFRNALRNPNQREIKQRGNVKPENQFLTYTLNNSQIKNGDNIHNMKMRYFFVVVALMIISCADSEPTMDMTTAAGQIAPAALNPPTTTAPLLTTAAGMANAANAPQNESLEGCAMSYMDK